MGSREKILQEIQLANTELLVNKEIAEVSGITFPNKQEQFMNVLQSIGGKVIVVYDSTEIDIFLNNEKQAGKRIATVLNEEVIDLTKEELYTIDIACIKGGIAVAENGTIWVTEKNMGNRILPFSTEQLIIVIEAKNIVNNMHDAYAAIDIQENGYGVFIAGPSKTADIEQSLVIGAHGPTDLIVFIIHHLN
jgi:L-lactate dehydrogenase complex protein LldG